MTTYLTMKLIALFVNTLLASTAAFTLNKRNVVTKTRYSRSRLEMVADNAKVVLVTGASRGLGRSIALELGSKGHKIIVNYAGSKDAADKTVEDIKAAGGDAVAIQANCKYIAMIVL